MGRDLGRVAERLSCSERTLRRCIETGLLRGRRLGARRIELPEAEQRYAETHWELLRRLRAALRTEPSVRLAVLFGSTALGEDEDGSDVDMLVSFDGADATAPLALARRLTLATGRHVEVVTLAQARRHLSLLADVVDEGRVLVDRDGSWRSLLAERERIVRLAERDEKATAARAMSAIEQARGRL